MNYNIYIQKNKPMYLSNELDLATTIGKLVDYVNDLIEREELLTKKLNDLIDESNTSINKLKEKCEEFKNTEISNYLVLETELLQSIIEFKNELETDVNYAIDNFNNTLDTIKLSPDVSSYFNSQLTTNYFTNLFNNTKTYVYSLYYMGADTEGIEIKNFYYYNTTTDTLYRLNTEVEPLEGCLYLYNNEIYLTTTINNKKVLRKVGA